MKKIVQRTCVGCNLKREKKELLRLVLNKKNEFFIDKTGKAQGRGIYLCNDINCLDKALKSKRLEKAFGIKINDELYENIRGVIIEKENKDNN